MLFRISEKIKLENETLFLNFSPKEGRVNNMLKRHLSQNIYSCKNEIYYFINTENSVYSPYIAISKIVFNVEKEEKLKYELQLSKYSILENKKIDYLGGIFIKENYRNNKLSDYMIKKRILEFKTHHHDILITKIPKELLPLYEKYEFKILDTLDQNYLLYFI